MLKKDLPHPVPAGARTAAKSKPRPDRKQAILRAAEQLFAEHGFHAVSVRNIARQAGVPLALVGYYFGQKHELFAAVYEQWRGTLEARLQGLHAVQIIPGDRQTLVRIITAFVEPVVRLCATPEGEHYALLVGRQLQMGHAESEAVLRDQFDPLAHAFIDALHLALPHASRAQVAWCYHFSHGSLMNYLGSARIHRLSHGENRAGDPAAAPMLICFIAGGIHAALPAPAPPR